MSGKGSKPRPIADRQTFESSWDRIFGDPKPTKQHNAAEVDDGRSKEDIPKRKSR